MSRLSERKASAEEDLFEGRLQLGDHQGVLPDLTAAVDQEPLRQRSGGPSSCWPCTRSGRQVEAMRAFQRLRSSLGEEYGLGALGRDQVTLELGIAMDRPELRWTPPTEPGVAPKSAV